MIQSTTSKPQHHSGILTTTTKLSRHPSGIQHALPEASAKKATQSKHFTFKELWNAYPSSHPLEGKDAPENQCTLKMSVALQNAGVDMSTYDGDDRIVVNGKYTAQRVKDMVKWLNTRPFPEISKPKDITGENWADKIDGKTGIIAFENYWERGDSDTDKRGKKKAPTGDHIDLWNGSRVTHNSAEGYAAYLGRGVGIRHFHALGHGYSDQNVANPILFWEIK